MSLSDKKSVAENYATVRAPSCLFHFKTEGLQTPVSISFLSVYPFETGSRLPLSSHLAASPLRLPFEQNTGLPLYFESVSKLILSLEFVCDAERLCPPLTRIKILKQDDDTSGAWAEEKTQNIKHYHMKIQF